MTVHSQAVAESDDRAIRKLVARADAAQDDPDALVPLHTSDAIIVNIAGRRVFGREAFATAMAGALSSPLRDVRTSVEVVDVRLANPETAIVSCIKTVHDQRADTDRTALAATGALTYVMVRSADGWLIALAHTTPVAT